MQGSLAFPNRPPHNPPLLTGGKLCLEGWNLTAAADYKRSEAIKLATNRVTGTVKAAHLSEPIIMIDPASSEHQVRLMATAASKLEREGPEEFHRQFGSHFVAGYTRGECRRDRDLRVTPASFCCTTALPHLPARTAPALLVLYMLPARGWWCVHVCAAPRCNPTSVTHPCGPAGGEFLGSFTVEFTSKAAARASSGAIKAGFSSAFASAEAEAKFKEQIKSTEMVQSVSGSYRCRGSSRKHPPNAACELRDLIEAHNKFDVTHGELMEAVLRRYSDLDDYRAARAKYYSDLRRPDDFAGFMQVCFVP